MKECARQADYTIPQIKENGLETPKSKDGEDIGVGKGWWYEGMFTIYLSTPNRRNCLLDHELCHAES